MSIKPWGFFVLACLLSYLVNADTTSSSNRLTAWVYSPFGVMVSKNRVEPFYQALSKRIATPIAIIPSTNVKQMIADINKQPHGIIFLPSHLTKQLEQRHGYKKIAEASFPARLYLRKTFTNKTTQARRIGVVSQTVIAKYAQKELPALIPEIEFHRYNDLFHMASSINKDHLDGFVAVIDPISAMKRKSDFFVAYRLQGNLKMAVLVSPALSSELAERIQQFYINDSTVNRQVWRINYELNPFQLPIEHK